MRFSTIFLLILSTLGGPSVFAESTKKMFNRYEFETIGVYSVAETSQGEPEPLRPQGVAGALCGVHGNALFVAGGTCFLEEKPWRGGTKTSFDKIGLFLRQPDGSILETKTIEKLPKPMGYAAVAQTPNGVVCLGGETADGPVDDAFVLRYDEKSQAVSLPVLPKLPSSRTAASAAVVGNRVYLLGGQGKDGPLDEMISLDLAEPGSGWRIEKNLPKPLAFAVAVAQSNGETSCVYLFGGRAKTKDDSVTNFSNSVYSFNPKTGIWKEETPLPTPLAAGCGAPQGIYSVFLFGGDDGEFFNANERRLLAIDKEKNSETKQKLVEERIRLLEEHQGFKRDVFLYNTITKAWTTAFELPQGSQVTTPAFHWSDGKKDQIVIPCGEIRPGVRSTEINSFRVFGQSHFTVLDYGVLGGYLLAMLGLGFLFMKQEGTGDFFFGGGRLPWWAVGISIFATTLSAITFLSVPAKAFAEDLRMSPYNLGILMVAPIVIRYYLPYFRRLNLETAYDYLERRFNRLVRYLASGLFIFFMVTRIAIVLFLPSIALNVATGIDVYFCILAMSIVTIIYCTMGGVEAVVWGDVIQGFILVAGAIVSLAVLIVCTDGGLAGFLQTSFEAGKLHAFDFRFDLTQPVFWAVMLGAFSNNIITYSSDQTLVQRYMCAKDEKESIRSIWLNAFLAVPVILIFFPIGTALFTYYRTHPDRINADLQNGDAIYPLFIVNGLPPGVSGLVLAAVFAAAMSTLASNINSASAAVYADFMKIWFPRFSKRFPVAISQTAGIVVGLLGLTFALLLASSDIRSLWDQFNTFLGLFTGPVGGLFLMGIFSKRINGVGAVVGLIGSFLTVATFQAYTPISFLYYGFLGMTSCYVYGFVVSLFVGGPAKTVAAQPENGRSTG